MCVFVCVCVWMDGWGEDETNKNKNPTCIIYMIATVGPFKRSLKSHLHLVHAVVVFGTAVVVRHI